MESSALFVVGLRLRIRARCVTLLCSNVNFLSRLGRHFHVLDSILPIMVPCPGGFLGNYKRGHAQKTISAGCYSQR